MDSVMFLLGTLAISAGGYLAWPSAWNVVNHMRVGSWIVSSLIPVLFAATGTLIEADEYKELANVVFFGGLAYLFGILIGRALAKNSDTYLVRVSQSVVGRSASVRRRCGWCVAVGLALLVSAIIGMGFVPMFAEDPMAAKFFRGPYYDLYRPYAVPFRAGFAILCVLFPLTGAYSLMRKGRLKWLMASLFAAALLTLTLQRNAIGAGLVIFFAVLFLKFHHKVIAVAGIFISYMAAALFYSILALFGLYIDYTGATTDSFAQTMASSVPDLTDSMSFLQRWEYAGEPLTFGRTFLGGIIPGNYKWNPGVWTLTLGDNSLDLSQMSTGGIRLPIPVWGLVSFGTIGIVMVPLVAGILSGWLARNASRAIEIAHDLCTQIYVIVAYMAISTVVAGFVNIGYIDLVQMVVIVWILGFKTLTSKHSGNQEVACLDYPAADTQLAKSLVRANKQEGRYGQ